jgi:peroxiredoxin
MVSPETAQLFVSKMPNAQYVDVADAAHMVVGDKNDIFAAQTLAFLRKHLPSSHSNL